MELKLPELGEGVYEAELVEWRVAPGDEVRRGQTLAEVLTDKASMELPSPFRGKVTALRAEPGDEIKVGEVVLEYEESAAAEEEPSEEAPAAEESQPEAKAAAEETATAKKARERKAEPLAGTSPAAKRAARQDRAGRRRVVAAPSVRRMARQLGVDLSRISGSGRGGRVLIEDLTAHVGTNGGAAPARPARHEFDYGRPGTRIPLRGLRRKIAEQMVRSKRTIPHYGYVDECDVTELVRLRRSLNEAYAEEGVKLTYLPFFVKAVVAALEEVPIVNASLDEESGEIVLHDRYNIGIAMATPGGLIVPVVHDADQKDLLEVAREIERLSEAARSGKVGLEELRGGTFTITSIGGMGGLISTPVINHPEVGILGIGKVVKRPVYDKAGNLHPADLVYLSFSFDHRVLDGAIGVAFGNALRRALEHPVRLLPLGGS